MAMIFPGKIQTVKQEKTAGRKSAKRKNREAAVKAGSTVSSETGPLRCITVLSI